MAYDEYLEERITTYLKAKKIPFEVKKMMGGLCVMVDDKMCVGVIKNELMARVGNEAYDELLKNQYAREMDFTKRPMNGYLYVEPEGIDREDDLIYWIDQCLAFNPKAKRSKKKTN